MGDKQKKPKISRYKLRKARMDKDPVYRAKVLQAQVASRRNARLSQLEQSDGVCGYAYPGGRHCWKDYRHTHAGVEHDPGARELATPA